MEITMNIVEDVSEMEEFIFVVKVMESNLDRHLHIVCTYIFNNKNCCDSGQHFLFILNLLLRRI